MGGRGTQQISAHAGGSCSTAGQSISFRFPAYIYSSSKHIFKKLLQRSMHSGLHQLCLPLQVVSKTHCAPLYATALSPMQCYQLSELFREQPPSYDPRTWDNHQHHITTFQALLLTFQAKNHPESSPVSTLHTSLRTSNLPSSVPYNSTSYSQKKLSLLASPSQPAHLATPVSPFSVLLQKRPSCC